MTDDNRGFEVGQEYVAEGVFNLPDGAYVVTCTTDSCALLGNLEAAGIITPIDRQAWARDALGLTPDA